MIILFRFFLVGLIVYLIFRSIFNYSQTTREPEHNKTSGNNTSDHNRKVSKDTGEYVDYEEVD